MVERFSRINQQLFAVLSNGQVINTPATTLAWRYSFNNVENINAIAAV
ncbi:MAG: hypothetical protein JW953_04975 [Anaerolineae bacterium]|nr:hypothetical protein [Anaerolineae bacterium]